MGLRLLFYVSAHGFGHATRTSAVLTALRRRSERPAVHVRSEAPHWIFRQRDPEVSCSEAHVDVGLLQLSGLDLDLPGTLAAHESFVSRWEERVEHEARAIAELGAALVVGDIPPLAFAAARRAGVPALAIANFSWDWVLEAYAEREPRWRPIAQRYREAYGESEGLFRLPFHGDLSAFPRPIDVPLVVHRSALTSSAARVSLGIPSEEQRRLVLVSFGGFGPGRLCVTADEDWSEYLFVGIGPKPEGFSGEWIPLPRPTPVAHEDLMRACDAMIGKPGYSSVAEALVHGTRFLYVPRTDFREIPLLEEGLRRYGCAGLLPREDFARGRWRRHLDALFTQPAVSSDLPAHGADVIAEALLRRARACVGSG